MKYVVRNEQDLEALLEEQCSQEHEIDGAWEWEGKRWHGCDVIILDTKGKWFDKKIVSQLYIRDVSVVGNTDRKRVVTKIKPEDKQKVKNTILYIQENFDHIYRVMLDTLLPVLIKWEVQNHETKEPITTIQQLHDAREIYETAGMESGCIKNIQLNCQYQKDDMVFYSMIYRPNWSDDGFDVVFWKDHVVFIGDGNQQDAIFEFENYKDVPTYFGI